MKLATTLISSAAVASSLCAADKPNIIFFLVDDMGWQDTSVQFYKDAVPNNSHFKTPNMEKLAKQGVRFVNAYATAVCSPSRTSMITGQNAAKHKVTNWTLHKNGETSGKTKTLSAPKNWKRNGIQPDDVLLPKVLQEQGYYTIHCGKLHMGAKGTPGEMAENIGFNINIAGHAAGGPGSYSGKRNFGSGVWQVPGLEKYHGQDINLTDALTIEASDAIEKAVKVEKKPFYLYMAHYGVHVPLEPHRPYYEEYKARGVNEKEAQYGSMITGMDASLGSLIKKLEELKVAENTVIIFMSDNGGLSVHGRGKSLIEGQPKAHNWPLKAGKGSAYEGGTRVPFIAAWAKRGKKSVNQKRFPINPNSVSTTQLMPEDIFPTIACFAGIKNLKEKAPDLDGLNMAKPICQPQSKSPKRPLLFHYPHVWGPRRAGFGYEPHSAMRLGDWKVIYLYDSKTWELYNLKEDISESKNVADENPEKLQSLAKIMQKQLDKMGAQYPYNHQTKKDELIVLPQ